MTLRSPPSAFLDSSLHSVQDSIAVKVVLCDEVDFVDKVAEQVSLVFSSLQLVLSPGPRKTVKGQWFLVMLVEAALACFSGCVCVLLSFLPSSFELSRLPCSPVSRRDNCLARMRTRKLYHAETTRVLPQVECHRSGLKAQFETTVDRYKRSLE